MSGTEYSANALRDLINFSQDVLDDAFKPVTLPSQLTESTSVPAPIPVPTPASAITQPESSESGSDESWKEEYDARVAHWRAESAVARQKAEETRAKFEQIRQQEEAEEKAKAETSSKAGKEKEWENVEQFHGGRVPLPGPDKTFSSSSPPVSISHPPTDHEDESHSRWEEIPSVASSFPSLPSHQSPPQPSTSHIPPTTATPSTREISEYKSTPSDEKAVVPVNPKPAPPGVTPLIFAKDLPVKTRALALISSLAINLFLPFVNGVMNGFGEIFARNVLGPWLGWKSIVRPNGTPSLSRYPPRR
ncbi:hypothetical protein FRC03_006662 [Tulasnella sp. 419]|nr:hypothetical protein FRC03_006662 [Tulasnella sp. 419]